MGLPIPRHTTLGGLAWLGEAGRSWEGGKQGSKGKVEAKCEKLGIRPLFIGKEIGLGQRRLLGIRLLFISKQTGLCKGTSRAPLHSALLSRTTKSQKPHACGLFN